MYMKEMHGDVWDFNVDADIVFSTSLDGVFEGFAAQVVERYPQIKAEIMKASLGDVVLIRDEDNHRKVLAMITSETNSRLKKNYENVQKALDNLKEIYEAGLIDSVISPTIGAGSHVLDWKRVRKMISKTFQGANIKWIICHYKPESK